MKNLANCTPSEFLKQTNLIKKSVEKWLKATDIMEIRKRMPNGMPEVTADMSTSEKQKVLEKRQKMLREQSNKNLSAILDAMLEEHPEETLEVLALCCFVEPKDVDSNPMSYYLRSVYEMIEDDAVKDFFTLLMSLAQ